MIRKKIEFVNLLFDVNRYYENRFNIRLICSPVLILIVILKEVIDMFHRAIDLKLLDGTALEVSFEDGAVKRYDMRSLFNYYPQFKALEDRTLFLSGKLEGAYGIIWNDELDIEIESIYENGELVRIEKI